MECECNLVDSNDYLWKHYGEKYKNSKFIKKLAHYVKDSTAKCIASFGKICPILSGERALYGKRKIVGRVHRVLG